MGVPAALLVSTDVPIVAMGLYSIAAVLEKNGIPCRVHRYESLAGLFEEIARAGPTVIGFSAHWHSQMVPSVRIAERVKREFPGVRIVLGGYTASWFAEDLVRFEAIDHVVVGAGEWPFLKIVQGAAPASIPNLVWKTDDGEVRRNPVRYEIDAEMLRDFVYGSLDDFTRTRRVIRMGTGCFHHCFHCGGRRDALSRHGSSSPVFLESGDIARVIERNFDALHFDHLYLAQDPFRDLKRLAEGLKRLPDRIKGKFSIAVGAWGSPALDEVRLLCASAPKVCLELTFDSLDEDLLRDSRGFIPQGKVLDDIMSYSGELLALPNLDLEMYFSYPHLHKGRLIFPDLKTLGGLFDLEQRFRKERIEGRFGLLYLLLSTDPESLYGRNFPFQKYWDHLLTAPSGLGSFCFHYEDAMKPDEFILRHLFLQSLMHLFGKATDFTQDVYRRRFRSDIRAFHDTLFALFEDGWKTGTDRGELRIPTVDPDFGYSCSRQERVAEDLLASAAGVLVDRCLAEGIFDRGAWEHAGAVL